jgi:PKD repeat protein
MRKLLRFGAVLATALAFIVGCGVHQADVPGLTGPSELALSVQVSAVPDSINRDGASQSSIQILARDAYAKPISGLALRADMYVGGALQDFGRLSARTIVTGSDGRASTVYTAPAAAPAGANGGTAQVTIAVTPTGSNYAASQTQSVVIRLVPTGVILPNVNFVPKFTFAPTSPSQGQAVFFDASTTTDPDGAVSSYAWSFGDGGTASGLTATHSFARAGAYSVTLTVADSLGRAVSTTQGVTVGGGTPPTADFTFSPTTPAVNQDIVFVATAQSGVAGHSIARYDWNFAGGADQSGQTVTKAYGIAGTFNVTLTVTDDLGLQKTVVKPVNVGGGGALLAAFTMSPSIAIINQPVTFDASTSTAPAGVQVAQYSWSFGDGSQITTASPVIQHTYFVLTDGTYTVSLTIRDGSGNTSSTSKSLSVTGNTTVPGPKFTVTPAFPSVGETVTFDGSLSQPGAPPATTVVNYRWDFGDGSAPVSLGTATTTHRYGAAGTYNATLTATNDVGGQASITKMVTVR